jgi:hypothetical protein
MRYWRANGATTAFGVGGLGAAIQPRQSNLQRSNMLLGLGITPTLSFHIAKLKQ